jgi:uncharacterized RDD family membrane protein YckC
MAMEPPDQRRSAPARLLEAGARGAERLAGATGVDKAVEDAVEEAIVRAMRSPAVERAIARGMDEGTIQRAVEAAVERALASDEVADAVIRALDTEVADRVWAEILASPKAQMLVERIAEAPEVRAAITEQGVGMITDLGRRLTAVTERLDDALERFAHRLMRRPPIEEETIEVGLVTRIAAAAIDLGLLSAALSISSGLLASVIPFVFDDHDGLSTVGFLGFTTLGLIIGGSLLTAFWALIGQTPGMRLLSIHLEREGTRALGLRPALRRLVALPVAVFAFGLGILAILVSPTRRGWHDRFAGTKVVYDQDKHEAPWSRLEA